MKIIKTKQAEKTFLSEAALKKEILALEKEFAQEFSIIISDAGSDRITPIIILRPSQLFLGIEIFTRGFIFLAIKD